MEGKCEYLIGFYSDFKKWCNSSVKIESESWEKKPKSKIYLPRNNPGDVSSNLNDNAVDS